MKAYFKNFSWYVIGCIIYSVAVTVFISPNQISPGGFTGVATALNYLTDISTGVLIMVFNIPVLIIGFLKFGGKFIINTTIVTGFASVMITFAEKLLPTFNGERILAAVFGGSLLGLSISIIMLHGATTGGVDILAKLINRRYRHITVGKIILTMDALVVILAVIIYGNFESALYSVVSMFACSRVMDAMLYGGDKGKTVFAITARADEICKCVSSELSRGITVIDVKGGYTGHNHKMLMCTVRVYEVASLYTIIEKYDSNAFIVVTEAGEIIGEGFKRFN